MDKRDDALIVFVKNAEKGKVKTRLAKGIGDDNALTVYVKLMGIASETAQQINVRRVAAFSKYLPEDSNLWPTSLFEYKLQQGDDIGQRMHCSIEQELSHGAKKVILIGSDCPGITLEILNNAYNQLDEADVVVGPAQDGGYYLIGMKKADAAIFSGITWSTSTVFEQTVRNIQGKKIKLALAPCLRDVDTLEDLLQFPQLYRHEMLNLGAYSNE